MDAPDAVEAPDTRRDRAELVATILLAVAAVATAWSTYQGSRWRGDQAVDTSRATAARIESSEANTRAGQLTQVDIATFTEWVDADVAGDMELADFYEQRFRDEFRTAFDAWLATDPEADPDAPLTPFEMDEYRVADAERATRLADRASEHSADAGRANHNADRYLLAVVLFAMALFFTAISGKLRGRRPREVLLGSGAVILVGTAVWVATFPVSLG